MALHGMHIGIEAMAVFAMPWSARDGKPWVVAPSATMTVGGKGA